MALWPRRRSTEEELDAAKAVERVLLRMKNDCTEARFQVLAAEADLRRLEEETEEGSVGDEWTGKLSAHRHQVSDLRKDLSRLEAKVSEAETYAGSLAARVSSARARLSLNDFLTDLEEGDSVEVFDRLRSLVRQREEEVSGMQEVEGILREPDA